MIRDIITTFCLLLLIFVPSQATIEGFYCDVFEDEGTNIGGADLKIDCEYIDFSLEHLNTNDKSAQAKIMIKNENDANGYLLYPDGEPRYALIYYHGGRMSHSKDLGEEGRQRVRDHYYHGGSQFGSCAGSYMLASYFRGQFQKTYFRLWAGEMKGPNVSSTPVDQLINKGSPLIGYHGFKAGDIVKGVRHNNGGSVDTADMPEGTIICSMHNSSKLKGYGAIWTWKDNDTTGSALGITGHPEGNSKEEQIKYISACMLYLKDCLGKPDIKHTLKSGQTITMDKETDDNQPLYTKIGDKQYHHFILDCETAQDVKIEVIGEEGFDFHLFAAKDTFAFKQSSLFADTASGNAKTLSIPKLEPGKWHIGVKLNTTVTTTNAKVFPSYGGKLEVLNGIAYSLKANWESVGILDLTQNQIRKELTLALLNNRMVKINVGKLAATRLQVFNMQGKLCWQRDITQGINQYAWQSQSTGMYVLRVSMGKDYYNQRFTIVR